MCCFADDSTAAFAGRGSALQYSTDVDAAGKLRLKNSTKTAPRKGDRQSLLTQQNAVAREKDIETAQTCSCHVKRKKLGVTRHSNYEAKEETSKMMGSKQRRRYPTATVGGRRPERFPCRYKRDRCCVRSWKLRNAANCQRNLCESRKESEMQNVMEDAESRSVGTTVQQFSNDEDEDKDRDIDNRNVKTFEELSSGEVATDICKNFSESSNGSHAGGQGMQTISEEDLDCPDDIEDETLREINGHEEDHRTAEHRPGFYSRELNQTTFNTAGEKLPHSPCARHKCSRCSQHSCYDSGVCIESLQIATARPKRNCHSTRPCTHGLCSACNYEVSLDAFRSCKRQYSTTQTSFLWKMATIIYEISGILKDGLVKLLADAEDDEAEESYPRDEMVCEDGWQKKRDVGTGLERASGICIRTRRSEEYNNEPRRRTETANRSDETTECPTGWNSANCKISTGSIHHKPENDLFDASRGEKSPRRLRGIEGASVSCAPKMRKNTFPPKTTSSESSISSLSSTSSFKYSCNAREDERVEKNAENYYKQNIRGRPASRKSTLSLMNKGNSTSSTETTVVNRSISKNEELRYSYDEIDARHSTSHSPTDIEDVLPDDEDVSLPRSTAVVEPEEVYEIDDLEELPDSEDRPEYSDKNKQCRLVRELQVGREPCPRDGRGFRDEIYCDSQKVSETDSATSSTNREYDRKRKRKFKLSGRERARKGSSRLNCRENDQAGRNYTVKKIPSKIDCKSVQPYETCIKSHLEYFKEFEEITLIEPSSSKIPRFVRPSSYRFCRSKSTGAGGETRKWDQESLAPVGNRKKKNSTCCSAQSTSHHFYI